MTESQIRSIEESTLFTNKIPDHVESEQEVDQILAELDSSQGQSAEESNYLV